MKRKKKKEKEGSCYIVTCQSEPIHWVVHLDYRPQHVCSDCKNYMITELNWHKATTAAQRMFEKMESK